MTQPTRKNNRLKEYDYAQNGAYFVTICTHERRNFFWNDVGAACGRPPCMPGLSNIGMIADQEINRIAGYYQGVVIEKYVVMPNHIHMIITLQNDVGRPKVAPTVSRIVQQFKGAVSKQAGFSLWQRSFYDHIIRNEAEYRDVWQYIDTNPLKWELNEYHINDT